MPIWNTSYLYTNPNWFGANENALQKHGLRKSIDENINWKTPINWAAHKIGPALMPKNKTSEMFWKIAWFGSCNWRNSCGFDLMFMFSPMHFFPDRFNWIQLNHDTYVFSINLHSSRMNIVVILNHPISFYSSASIIIQEPEAMLATLKKSKMLKISKVKLIRVMYWSTLNGEHLAIMVH